MIPTLPLIPAKAGIQPPERRPFRMNDQLPWVNLDPGLRRDER